MRMWTMAWAFLLPLLAVAGTEREKIVYVSAHPDDLGGSLGTIMRLAESYDVHVVDFTHGERGLGEAQYRDGSCAKLRTVEETEVCKALGVTLHWCDEIDGEAFAGRKACEGLADLFRRLKPRAIIVHWLVDTHYDHMMSAAAAIKATQLAGLKPEIYFQEQEGQSRAFPAVYYVDITDKAQRKKEIAALWACQGGAEIGERKHTTGLTNARRIWGSCGRVAEVFGVMPGTVAPGKGIFDCLSGVSR